MSQEDIHYYSQRVIIERRRAENAPSPQIALVHEELAELYENFIQVMGSPANDLSGQASHTRKPAERDMQQLPGQPLVLPGGDTPSPA